MSIKNVVLDPANPKDPDWAIAPRSVRTGTDAARASYAATHNERYRTVATCQDCAEELIAEELIGHLRAHVPDNLRPLFTMIAQLDPADRTALYLFVNGYTEIEARAGKE